MNLTTKLCNIVFDMIIKQVIIKNLKLEIKNKLFSNNMNNKIKIIERMMFDFKNNQVKQNLEHYIYFQLFK